MNIGKIVAAVLLLAVGTSLSAQDLANAAKKEKERRAALKNKPSVTVTNDDLERSKKKAAFIRIENNTGEALAGEEAQPAEPEKKPTAVPAEPDEAVNVDSAPDPALARAELQDRYNRAKEHLDYLNLKMRALQQQLFSFNTMETKDKVQRDIAETRDMFQAAEADEAQLKKELDDFSSINPIK
ncbi:MAG: hypothetical protein ACYDH3_07995 [Candidatus Aminicenantales bacterium]